MLCGYVGGRTEKYADTSLCISYMFLCFFLAYSSSVFIRLLKSLSILILTVQFAFLKLLSDIYLCGLFMKKNAVIEGIKEKNKQKYLREESRSKCIINEQQNANLRCRKCLWWKLAVSRVINLETRTARKVQMNNPTDLHAWYYIARASTITLQK